MNKLAFYYDSVQIPQDHIIENLKNYLYSQNTYGDFVIFTNIMFPTTIQYSLLPTFYSKFFNGTIVFFDSDDYEMHNRDNSLLYVHDSKDLLDRNINYKYNILMYDESVPEKYRIFQYDTIRSTL